MEFFIIGAGIALVLVIAHRFAESLRAKEASRHTHEASTRNTTCFACATPTLVVGGGVDWNCPRCGVTNSFAS